jgi:hypothetical protein
MMIRMSLKDKFSGVSIILWELFASLNCHKCSPFFKILSFKTFLLSHTRVFSCAECLKGLYLHEGRCEAACPEQYFPSVNAKSQPVCSYCHYTCKACSGPSDYQCSSCYGDASLKHTTEAESYCYPKAILPALETSKWFYWMFIAFSANVTVLIMIVLYFIMCKLFQNFGCCSKHQHYRKMSNGENLTDSLAQDRNSAVYDLSESDSDGS